MAADTHLQLRYRRIMQVSMVTAGSVLSAVVHGSLVLALLFAGMIQKVFGKESAPPIEERHVIEARLVQLGKELDPSQLPNRKVPALQTAPPDSIAVSKEMNPDEPTQQDEKKDKPPNPTEDLLTRLGDRAQTFAEIAEQREKEGSPDGVEDGSSMAQVGDLYAGKLYALFRRGWTVPTVISDAERNSLKTEVDLQINEDLSIGNFSLRKSSGNPLFDQSVLDNIERLKSERVTLPAPPSEVADQFLGKTLGLRFSGRHAG
ncbi:MAG: TonB C-terminal domain-containing protein [Myxococcales bacterium]|nr:MAG: TonB C-terminal domain-containing protein [Myxococcales bacterium]